MTAADPQTMTREELEAEVRTQRTITPTNDGKEHARWKAIALALAEGEGKTAGMLDFGTGPMGFFVVTCTGDERSLALEFMRLLKADRRASRGKGAERAIDNLNTLKALGEAMRRSLDAKSNATISDMVDAIFAAANQGPTTDLCDLELPGKATPEEIRETQALVAAAGLFGLKWTLRLGRAVAELPGSRWLSHTSEGWWLLSNG